MNEEIQELKKQADEAKHLYRAGLIDRDKAKSYISPYIIAYNKKSEEIAKKYNQKAKTLTFASFVR